MWPKDNLESWQKIHEFIAEFPDKDHWPIWKRMAEDVISSLENRGLAPSFRIGQSMHQIIFSTLDHHVLAREPRVTLQFDPDKQFVRVAYSDSLVDVREPFSKERYREPFRPPLSEEWVSVSNAVQTTLNYLRRLWSETRASTPMPEALNDSDS